MRVPRVQFTVRRMIGAILIVALILALVIQSERAARLERRLAASEELTRVVTDELIDARKVIDELSRTPKALAREILNGLTSEYRPNDLGPPKGRSPGAERVPSGRGRDRREPPSPGPVK